MNKIVESVVEEAALDWFRDLGWSVLHGPDISRANLQEYRG